MTISTEDNKNRFKTACDKYIKRDGVKELLDWLDTTDFYTAPASTRYHGAYEGGLCEHSLNVFNETCRLLSAYKDFIKVPAETAAICALFHDVCKVGCYKVSERNVKNDETGKWEKQPYYAWEEQLCYGGHGSKSVHLISKYVKLTDEESVAINCHMSCWDGQVKGLGDAYQQYPFAWLLHVADEASDFVVEKKSDSSQEQI